MTDALGVTVSPHGLDAALDLPNAESVWLCVYDGDREVFRTEMPRDGERIFRGRAPDFGSGARYGFRVKGPHDPSRGLRFDASKLLADPYAWAFDRPFRSHSSMFAFGEDSGPFTPKAIAGAPPAGDPGRRRVATDALLIYELNLRGFSRLNMSVPESARGTFAGLAHHASIAHLSSLGVTAVEVMPADPFIDERHLPPLGLNNAWGYNSVVFGSPDPRLAPGGWAEVRAATDALHAAGIEAILDVVFNHNGESDELGATLSFRGLDNQTFFRLNPNNPALYVNDTGCGNTLALDRPLLVDMAIGAMKRWVVYGGFDGFRFDLATTLGRTDHGFDANAPLFQALANDPILRETRLIAEPWDVGWGGYQLGRFPSAFGEWNDHYRDAARRFWRGDPSMRGEIATRIAGSRDIFGDAAAPSKGVNFIVAHDGFTLSDLVAYEHKHNDANGEHNRDGTDSNLSWNHGVEGSTDDPAILGMRARDQRNLLTQLLTSRGTPMLAMGAELGFSQNGNNNAYAQDNETTALKWSEADTSLIAFTRRLAEVRRTRPALSRDAFLTGHPFDANGMPDVEWRDAQGPLSQDSWNDSAGAVLVAVFSAPGENGVDRVAVAMNRSRDDAELILPEPREGMAWRSLVDTAHAEAPERTLAIADRQRLVARSCLVLGESPAPAGPRSGPPTAGTIDALSTAAGIASEWWDVSGKRTVVSPETKISLLAALGLDAGSEARARESLAQFMDETQLRRVPLSLALRADEPLVAPLRDAPQGCEARIECEDGQLFEWRIIPGDGVKAPLADGREVAIREAPLPSLPLGRHRLILDGVEFGPDGRAVARPRARRRGAQAVRRVGAALCDAARGRPGDRRFLHPGLCGRSRGRRGRRLSRREPHAYALPARSRAGQPLPSVRPAFPRSDPDRRS